MEILIRRLGLLLALLIALSFTTTHASGGYTVIDLGTLGGRDSNAWAINDRGQVVGDSLTSKGERHAFLWDKGAMLDLGTLGGATSYARAINNRGQIVGVADTADGVSRAFLWEKGRMIDLGTLTGGRSSGASGINNRGQIVGWSSTATEAGHAFLWDKGHMIDLGALGDGNSAAAAINDNGQVAGSVWLAAEDVNRAFIWQDGVMTTLAPLPGDTESAAGSINNRGQVVGGSIGATTRATVWRSGNPTALAAELSGISDINDGGLMAGQWKPSPSEPLHAAVWDHGQPMQLPLLGGHTDSNAMSVNSRGQLVGRAWSNGEFHAMLWAPAR